MEMEKKKQQNNLDDERGLTKEKFVEILKKVTRTIPKLSDQEKSKEDK